MLRQWRIYGEALKWREKGDSFRDPVSFAVKFEDSVLARIRPLGKLVLGYVKRDIFASLEAFSLSLSSSFYSDSLVLKSHHIIPSHITAPTQLTYSTHH